MYVCTYVMLPRSLPFGIRKLEALKYGASGVYVIYLASMIDHSACEGQRVR